MKINRAIKTSVAILVFLSAGMLSGTSEPAWAGCRIENISLERAGKFTRVSVYADGPFEFVHSTEEAKDGKPYRVIIDCKDALFALPQNSFREGLPSATIKGIRTSQFQAFPERIVRVVLDLKGAVVYKVIDTGEKNRATIGILAASDPNFPVWMASETKPGKGQVLARREKQAAGSTARAETQRAHKKGASQRALSYADARETAATTEKKQTASKRTWLRRKISRYAAPLGPFPQEETLVQTAQREEVKKIEASERMAVKTTPPTAVKTEKDQIVSSSGAKPSLSFKTPTRRRISRSPTPLGPFAKEEPLVDATQKKVAETKAVRQEDASTSTSAIITEGIAKILGPESVVAKETQMLSDSLVVLAEPQKGEVDLVPQRKRVQYDPGTKRDPFAPLVDKQDMTFGAAPLPLFENLKLVGILRDDQGNRALLEDEIGFGYILMAGDRIRNGYVISVEDDRATFHIEEYGGFQIMVMELNTEY